MSLLEPGLRKAINKQEREIVKLGELLVPGKHERKNGSKYDFYY